MISLYQAIAELFKLIELILFIRILLSWFPNIKWWEQPFKLLYNITEPILAPFRRIIPPLGGLDLSPIVVFLLIGMLEKIVLSLM